MCFKWHEKSKLSRQTRCSLAALNQIYSCFVLFWLCPSPFSICSTIRRATTVSQCIVLTNHKSHFGAYSGPEPVFLLRWPFCLRAGDLSRLNHPVTFPPTAQHISMGKEYDFSCSAPPPSSYSPTFFCSFSAFLHTYSISLQSEGWGHLRRGGSAGLLGGLISLIFKVVTHFKMMLQITTKGSSIRVSFTLATAVFACCSSNL